MSGGADRSANGASNCDSRVSDEAFRCYIAAFNRNDFDGFGRYYADDVEFEGRAGRFHGRDDVLSFYRRVKARVRETIAIQGLVPGEHALAADLITELYALEDWPDFPTGALHKGETRRSQNFVWYDIAGGRFTRIRSAHYRSHVPPPCTPDPLPAAAEGGDSWVCGQSITVQEFAAYIDAFNRDDYGAFSAYYDPDVVLVISGHLELRGTQAICDFYRSVKAQSRRTLEVRNFISTQHRVAAELESEFLALEDLPDFAAGPMKKGGRILLRTLVLYELRDRRFVRIRSAPLRKLHRP